MGNDKLLSIEDVLKNLDKSCHQCDDLGWPGRYRHVEKRGDQALYHCSFVFHTHKLGIEFQTKREDIEELIKEVQSLIKRRPGASASKQEIRNFLEEADPLTKKLQIYADFAPKDLKISFTGFCHHCYRDVPVTIKENRVYYSCSPCATIVADTISG